MTLDARIPVAFRLVEYLSGGNHYGYRTMMEGFDRALGAHVIADPDAPTALQFCAPMVFEPVAGKRNVLVTMYETMDLPQDAIDAVRRADVLVVPSHFCVRIFRQVTEAPIYVVPLGVEAPPLTARTLGVPFRWLWCGALNIRKGWPVLAETWDRYFNRPGYAGTLELYVKTTLMDEAGMIERQGALVFDSRNVDRAELERLYASAHAFVYPTLGEGFGLTLAEAMGSGLPCVATDYGGHLDFARDLCRLVPARLRRVTPTKDHPSAAPDGKYGFATLRPENLARDMLWVMQHYDQALAMGRKAAKAMQAYTWDAAAQKLAAILRKEARRAERVAA